MEIAFCRIDDRLIHGQVATVWSKVTGCNRIMCVSDEVAKDELRKKLLLQVVPPGAGRSARTQRLRHSRCQSH